MRTVKFLSLTLLMSIICTGMTFAQQQRGQKGGKAKATQEDRAAQKVEKMKKTLDLTPEQVKKIQELQTQLAKDQEQSRAAAKEKRQDMKAKKEAYDAQLKTILTPEQYQKYQDNQGQGQRKEKNKDGAQQGKGKRDKKGKK